MTFDASENLHLINERLLMMAEKTRRILSIRPKKHIPMQLV